MDISSLVIVGVIVSLLVQFIKNVLKAGEYTTLAIVAGISILAGLFFQLFGNAGWFDSAVQVLVYAGAIYTFIISRFTGKSDSGMIDPTGFDWTKDGNDSKK